MTSSVVPVRVRQAHRGWSLTAGAAVRGLGLARESGTAFFRDANHWLYLVNQTGARQAQFKAPQELTALACSDDGGGLVVGGKGGDVWSLAPDLMPRWQVSLGKRVEAVAVTPLGDYVAAADAGGQLSLLTRKGRPVWRIACPRPLHFLAFASEEPLLAGSADFGLVAVFDAAGAMKWRDGPVVHVGSLAVGGASIVLASYTDGLTRYGLHEGRPERQALADPCRLAAPSYDGRHVLTAGLTPKVQLLDSGGRVAGEYATEAPATAVALSALADHAVLGTATGLVECIRWR